MLLNIHFIQFTWFDKSYILSALPSSKFCFRLRNKSNSPPLDLRLDALRLFCSTYIPSAHSASSQSFRKVKWIYWRIKTFSTFQKYSNTYWIFLKKLLKLVTVKKRLCKYFNCFQLKIFKSFKNQFEINLYSLILN